MNESLQGFYKSGFKRIFLSSFVMTILIIGWNMLQWIGEYQRLRSRFIWYMTTEQDIQYFWGLGAGGFPYEYVTINNLFHTYGMFQFFFFSSIGLVLLIMVNIIRLYKPLNKNLKTSNISQIFTLLCAKYSLIFVSCLAYLFSLFTSLCVYYFVILRSILTEFFPNQHFSFRPFYQLSSWEFAFPYFVVRVILIGLFVLFAVTYLYYIKFLKYNKKL